MVDSAVSAYSTVPELLATRAEELGDRVALIGDDGMGTQQTLSFRELEELSRALGARLVASIAVASVEPPARVAWAYGNSNGLLALVTYHAVCAIGAVNVPINPAASVTEVGDLLERANACLMIASPGFATDVTTGARRLEIGCLDDLRSLADAGPGRLFRAEVPAHRPSVVLFTSGTTGRSKGVVHSHITALAAGRGWCEAFGLGRYDVYQSMFPVYAGAGLHFSWLACLLAGATYAVDMPRPTSASLERVQANRATVYAAVPSIYQYWLTEQLADYDLSSLRLLDFGGAVMHRSTIEALRSALPAADLIQSYGLTEAGPGGLYLPAAELDRKLGSIGRVGSGGLSFRVDTGTGLEDDVTDFGDDLVGELMFAGPSLMLGYLDDPENTEKVYDGEWMRTGDLVRVDRDGYVYFLDRLKDLIIRGGFNISSIEVEEAVLAHRDVAQAAAFGVTHESLGEVVGVAVVPTERGALDLSDLRRFIGNRLSRVKVPAWVIELDELPMSAAGKVLKTALRCNSGLRQWRD